jgi:hypothetical protein
MIQFKYRHLWKKYNGFWYYRNNGIKTFAYICIKCNMIEESVNITQYLPNCIISEDEWVIKNILE